MPKKSNSWKENGTKFERSSAEFVRRSLFKLGVSLTSNISLFIHKSLQELRVFMTLQVNYQAEFFISRRINENKCVSQDFISE